MTNRKPGEERGGFQAIPKYEVRVAEEILPEAGRIARTHPHAAEILGRLCAELETFPPNARHFSEPEVSFNGVLISHAVVVSENLIVRLVAHYRLNGVCMVVHVEAGKNK